MLTQAARPFLDLRALAALEGLRFSTRHRIDGSYSGRHASRQLGGAGEFVDYREYAAGEDLRRLDWKVLARTGRSYVRLYQDETNLVCTLVLDASGSMAFGGLGLRQTKLAYTQYLATALAHVISRGQDQVGLAVAAERLREFIAPGGTPTQLAQIYDKIETVGTTPATRMADSLRDLFSRLSRRGVLLLMSDFLWDDLEEAFSALRLFRRRYWEVILLHIVHPEEERLPQGAAFRFDGLEGEGHLDCSPLEIASLYERRFAAHSAMVRTVALSTGCDYRRVLTSTPYLQILSGFLVERAG
ncbi:MAG TPA: DUF58 domain-containing protein [Pirellulales bacterium]|jgi:uncharacterized protein (DUF58 family)|nr:DUF58 domain-containing protein [Pirellulales bacterium]